jgi:hypothetical protein
MASNIKSRGGPDVSADRSTALGVPRSLMVLGVLTHLKVNTDLGNSEFAMFI